MYQPQQPRSAVNSCLCLILSIMTAIVVSLGVIILIMYFIFRPRYPEIRVDTAQLTSLIVTSNQQYLTAKWDITFIASNPNKKLDITYNAVSVGVFYGEKKDNFGLLAKPHIQSFYQPKKSKTLFGVHVEVVDKLVGSAIVKGITDERFRGSVKFGVVFNAVIKRKGLFQPKERALQVTCSPLNFVPSNTPTWVLQHPVKCEI